MDVSGDVADLMVKESIQLTEASIKLLAGGSRDLTAFLLALARDNKKLVGKTGMNRLLRDGKELKVFQLRESDLAEFTKYAKNNVLFAVIKNQCRTDGLVDLVTSTDFVSQVNLFMERRGYGIPGLEDKVPKKAASLAQPDNYSAQRGNGLIPLPNSSMKAADLAKQVGKITSVRERLAYLKNIISIRPIGAGKGGKTLSQNRENQNKEKE